MPDQISVLFCCMGNICRSTMAEGVFQSIAKKAPYEGCISQVDSCGTSKETQKTCYQDEGVHRWLTEVVQLDSTRATIRTTARWRRCHRNGITTTTTGRER